MAEGALCVTHTFPPVQFFVSEGVASTIGIGLEVCGRHPPKWGFRGLRLRLH